MADGSQYENFPSCPIGISPEATCAHYPLSFPCDSLEGGSLSCLLAVIVKQLISSAS